MNDRTLSIDAGTILTPTERYAPGRIVITNGFVEAVGLQSDLRHRDGTPHIQAPGLTLVPGFIELHVHGGGGRDVMEATPESIGIISRFLTQHGTTTFLPTTVSAPADVLDDVLHRLGAVLGKPLPGAQATGIHLEGPFINAARRGTHGAGHLHPPDASLLLAWIRRTQGNIRLVTLAPELNGAAEVTAAARASNVVVAMGHSDASYDQAIAAVDSGVVYAVHTFNAMRPMTHRDAGIVGAVLADDRVFAEIIADGVHVNPEVVRIFARAKRPGRILLVTDGISATGMPDGQYGLGKDTVQVRQGVCRDSEGRLAGSTLTQDAALRNVIAWTGMSLQEALLGLTVNPATVLNLADRGVLDPGKRADMTLLDDTLNVVMTFVGGEPAFERRP